ncbi:MAG: serine/threonine-protein kinase, partial [Myxococcota bacterium]
MPDADAAAPMAEISDLAGRVFNDRYRLLRKVGAGSMGDVYGAQRISDGVTVAVKVLKPEHAIREVFRHRFLREAKSAVPIEHPNVVDVMDFGTAGDGSLYIAMEFLEGEDLASYLSRLKQLSWRQSCALLQQAASGLAAAHARGVVHRDVKPSNILLVDDSSGGAQVKIVDFGVAKLAGQPVSKVLTQVDDVVGTVAYMSPEQAEGRAADRRSDIYALGVTAYELATGRVPFEGRDMFQVMMGHLETAPRPPSDLVDGFPPAANAFILRCLAKRPEARFQTMDEVLAMLQNAASPDAVSLPPPVLDASRSAPATAANTTDEARGPDAFDDEAPTGYFFKPVEPPANPPPSNPPVAPAKEVTPRAVAVSTAVAPEVTMRTPPLVTEIAAVLPSTTEKVRVGRPGLPGGTLR